MRVVIEVGLTPDRLTTRVVGRAIEYTGPNRVALERRGGTNVIAAIGDDADRVPGAKVVPIVADESFDPTIAAGVVGYLGLLMWDRVHPGWRGPLGLLDRVDVWIAIPGFEQLDAAPRAAFLKALPHRPSLSLTWRVDDEQAST